MAVIINATTTTGLTTSADNSGVIQFQSNGANTVGISSTGYLTIGGNQQIYGPAFSAYRSTGQNITSATWTKVQLNNENYDTNNCFDSSTNYRFTPNVAGYYMITASIGDYGSTTASFCQSRIDKNGAVYVYGNEQSGTTGVSTVSVTLYMNGTTDYLELYGYISASTAIIGSDGTTVRMTGSMIRGA